MRAWVGVRNRRAHGVTVEVLDGPAWTIARPLLHIPYHSPDGFEWGYGGSGPADLALSMLADYFRETPELVAGQLRHADIGRAVSWAVALHQAFKDEVIARQTGDTFRLNETEIDRWVALPSNQLTLSRLAADNQEERQHGEA